jgi:hypothetical protein
MTNPCRSKFLYLLLACAIATSASVRADTTLLTMDDLAALDKQESWQELFTHLDDVPPTKRTDKWGQMLERATAGVLATYESHSEKAWVFAGAALRQYPALRQSKRFMALRTKVGPAGLDACLQHSQMSCVESALTFLEADPADSDLAWSFGNSIAKRDASAAVRVFKRALDIRHTAKECGQDVVKKAVVASLRLSSEDPRVGDAKAIAFELCWDVLKEPVIDGFINGDSDYRKNTCPILLTKKDALSAMSKRQCEALNKP